MAIGDIVSKSNAKKTVKLLEGATATSVAPTTVNDGVPCYPTNQIVADDGHCYMAASAQSSTLNVDFAAGASASVRMWGYLAAAAKWFPIDSAAIALTANYAQRYSDLGHYDRLYLQVTAISASTVHAYLTTARTVSF
jgi:hypothetical protein